MQVITMNNRVFDLNTYAVEVLPDNSLQLKDASGAYAQGQAGAWIDAHTNQKIMVSDNGVVYCSKPPELLIDPHPYISAFIDWQIRASELRYITIFTRDDGANYKMPVGEHYVYIDGNDYAVVLDDGDYSSSMVAGVLDATSPTVVPIVN